MKSKPPPAKTKAKPTPKAKGDDNVDKDKVVTVTKTRDNVRCKEWERQRRDRLCEAFKGLGQLLPNHDPAKELPKINVLEKATQFIKELRLSNSRLLTQQTQAEETTTKIKELQDELNKLILRVRQLTRLLNQAKIPIPMGPFIKALGKKRKKWSNQLTTEDLENNKRQKIGDHCVSKSKDPPKLNTSRVPVIPTVTIISGPLKEANSADTTNATPEKTSTCSIPLASTAKPKDPPDPEENPLISKASASSNSINPVHVNPPMSCILQQPATAAIPNGITFPLQSYILTPCTTQQSSIFTTRFAIGPSPRIILSKPPLSGNIPKVAIPSLRKTTKVVLPPRSPSKPRKKKESKAKETKPTATPKPSETQEKTEKDSNSTQKVEPVTVEPVAPELEPEPEPQPPLVDISGPVEIEIESEVRISAISTEVIETDTEKVVTEENSGSIIPAEKPSELAEKPDAQQTPEIVAAPDPVTSLESETHKSPSVTVEIPEPVQKDTSDSDKQTPLQMPVLQTPEPLKENPKDLFQPLEPVDDGASARSNTPERLATQIQSSNAKESESESDKISECIARSIDLIDHPEADAELMELGAADWGVGHSPKSPISPTQMFLSMFPLLPRESIVTVAESSVSALQQQTPHHPLPDVKNLNSFSSTSRSSFFIDSMLPEQAHESSTTTTPLPRLDNLVCLAVTPITPSCIQQNSNLRLATNTITDYPSPPSFQSLAPVVPPKTTVKSQSQTSSKIPTSSSSTSSSNFFQSDKTQSQNHNIRNFTSIPSTYESLPNASSSGTQKRGYQHTLSQEFYPSDNFTTDKPRSSAVAQTNNSSSHTISQMFNSFVNTTPPRQQQQPQPLSQPPSQSFHENYTYYPQEILPHYNNTVSSTKYSGQNMNLGSSYPHTQGQGVDDSRNRQPQPQPESRSQQSRSELFRPASNVFSQSQTSGNNPTKPNESTTDKQQRLHSSSSKQQSSHNLSEFVPPQNTNTHIQSFSHSQHQQYVQPPLHMPMPSPSTRHYADANFTNFTQNRSTSSTNSSKTSSQNQNQTHGLSHSFATATRSTNNSGTSKQPQAAASSRPEFNADFLAYSPHNVNVYRQGPGPMPVHCSYDNTNTIHPPQPQPSSNAPSITQAPKTSYRSTSQAQPPVQQVQQHSKSRRPPFYLPDPPLPTVPTLPSQSQYENLPNYSIQTQSRPAPPAVQQQSGQSHYSNNFVPQFYNNNRTGSSTGGGNKEYHQQQQQSFSNHNLILPSPNHQHQGQMVGAPDTPQPQSKKSVQPSPILNFTPSNNPQTRNTAAQITNPNQASQPQNVSRPVNWMTDPPQPHKKSTATAAANPFSVSKLVGNNTNNYCTEAIIRKHPNPDWATNEFHCFLPPPGPPMPVPPICSSAAAASQNSAVVHSQPTSFSPATHQSVHNPSDYFPHNPYSSTCSTNFGNFDGHNLQHCSSSNMGQTAPGQIHPGSSSSSVSNFNLSTIFPEINDKRGNNTNSGGNFGYYGNK